jgi:predicted metal-dependent TIM-barrel fold hydrolase
VVFDAHLRAQGLAARDVADLRWFGVEGALCPATDAVAPVTAVRLRRSWEQLVGRTLPGLRRAGLAAYAALGVPPACIPWRGLEALLADLPELLSRPGVVAIGPVGLERATEREEMVFARQLDMARELRLPVLVHTPARDKVRLTRRALAMLLASGVDPRRVLVDHADARTVRIVRAVGYGAVISLSAAGRSGRGAVEEAAALVRALGPEGIALASDAGEGLGDLLALPRVADRMGKLGLSDAVIRRVCGRNALDALGLAPAEVRALAGGSTARSGRPPSP